MKKVIYSLFIRVKTVYLLLAKKSIKLYFPKFMMNEESVCKKDEIKNGNEEYNIILKKNQLHF